MALDTLLAKANTGSGTDALGGEIIDGKFVSSVRTVDIAGNGAEIATEASLSALLAKINTAFAEYTSVPENQSSAPAQRLVGQDIWNCSFSDVGASVLAPEFISPIVGSGVTYAQASGTLTITAGTSANAEFLARSIKSWRSSMMLSFSCVLSQRIANNNFAYILGDLVGEGLAVTINSATQITVTKAAHGYTTKNVGQFIFVGGIVGAAGVPGRYAIASVVDANTFKMTVAGWPASGSCTATLFGHSHHKVVYSGVTATNATVNSQRRGWSDADTTATIFTTAAPGHIVKMHVEGRSVQWSDILRASTTVPTITVRASRFENQPDDNLDLYLFLWSYNGTVAPASSTTWTISFCAVEKFAALPVYDQGSKPQGYAWPKPVALPFGVVVNSISAIAAGANAIGDVGVQYRANATGAATPAKVIAAASTNATSTKATAGRVVAYDFHNNAAAARYVKFYNKATAPVVGTDVPTKVVALPAGGSKTISIPGGIAFATGIAYAIVTGAADADATAVAANDVVGGFEYA